jgi:hypothetical protein
VPKLKKVRCDCERGAVATGYIRMPGGAGKDTWVGIETCDECQVFPSDERAALAVAEAGGGTAFFISDAILSMCPAGAGKQDFHEWMESLPRDTYASLCVQTAAARKAGLQV